MSDTDDILLCYHNQLTVLTITYEFIKINIL